MPIPTDKHTADIRRQGVQKTVHCLPQGNLIGNLIAAVAGKTFRKLVDDRCILSLAALLCGVVLQLFDCQLACDSAEKCFEIVGMCRRNGVPRMQISIIDTFFSIKRRI